METFSEAREFEGQSCLVLEKFVSCFFCVLQTLGGRRETRDQAGQRILVATLTRF